MVEEWRTIEGASRYEVSNLGNVRSWVRFRKPHLRADEPRLMKQTADPMGRMVVNLTLDTGGRQKVRRVHQLVAEAFLGPRPLGMVTCHNNGDPSDNRVSNLRYDTFLSNMHDKFKHGTNNTGSQNPMAKLDEGKVREIRRLYANSITAADLALRFGVTESCINAAVKRVTWAHV